MRKLVVPALALLLAGCEMKVGGDGGAGGNQAGPAPAAKDGQISIDTPGFDMKLDIPDALRTRISGDGDLIYPGATVNGLNIAASGKDGPGGGRVEMRFSTPDAPAKVAQWYRDPARAAQLAGVSVAQDGADFRVSGSGVEGGDPFDLRLSPAAGGGTQAVLRLQDRG